MNAHNRAIDDALHPYAIRSILWGAPPQHDFAPAVYDEVNKCNSRGVIFARYELGPGDLLGWYFNHGLQNGSRTLIKDAIHARQLLTKCGLAGSNL